MYLIFAGVVAITIVAPELLITLLTVNALVAFAFFAGQAVIALFPASKPNRREGDTEPFVSVLVPTYNEPPEIILETVEALACLEYSHYEVLIIDNNTADRSVWEPVERRVANLGPQIRFIHVDELEGFKAGALNYVLERVPLHSTYIAVIDADYIVKPDFLTTAISYFTDRSIALVQFPQEYRDVPKGMEPLSDEYRHFFKVYMHMANHLDCVPATGTLSVYRADSLRSVGGFTSETITEDAEMGLRLCAAGFSGVFVDRVVGQGFMPYDVLSYRKQKRRWAFGNAQAVAELAGLFRKLPMRSWFGSLLHLTAWHHLTFLPLAALTGSVLSLTPLASFSETNLLLVALAGSVIVATPLVKFLLFLSSLFPEKRMFTRAFKALLVHMGLTLIYAKAPFEPIVGTHLNFERTNKFVSRTRQSPVLWRAIGEELLLGAWCAVGAFCALLWGTLPLVLIYATASLSLFSAYYVYRLFQHGAA